ncbi:MAG TPA: site-2 protease family protein [Candidatus Dormibacteraeota bacterium]|nr:site-2 protease family protein [Candidatus Dormibacteraeota bacterium]
MDASVRIGRIAGIEVGLNWSLAIVFVLIVWTLAGQVLPSVAPGQQQSAYWLVSVIAVVLFYVSLLSHELGHAIVARRLGVQVDGITLWIFGGVARLRGDAATPGTEVKIAIAGPLVSLALAILFGAATFALDATGGPALVEGGIAWLAGTNAMLLLFNLIPAFPLDGGRLLRAWLWQRSGDRYRATSGAARLGRICAFLMIGLGLLSLFINGAISGLWLIFLGWFLMSAARSEESQVLLRGALSGLRVADVMSRDPATAPGWITVDEFMRSYVPMHHATAYPIKTFDGALDGLVTLARLAQVPQEERHLRRVRDVGTGMDEVAKAAPGEPVTAVLDRFSPTDDGQMLVMDGGELVGLLSPGDITRALRAKPALGR